MAANELDAQYWEQSYQRGETRWNAGEAAPPLLHLLNSSYAPKPGKIAVLGSGHGYDALLFAEHGFEVIGFDVAPSAIAHATALATDRNLSAKFYQQDLFNLEPQWHDRFDYVLESKFFTAIAPSQRSQYIQLVHSLLRSHGLLIGLFLIGTDVETLPRAVEHTELLQLFSTQFEKIQFELATDSPQHPKGYKYFATFRSLKS